MASYHGADCASNEIKLSDTPGGEILKACLRDHGNFLSEACGRCAGAPNADAKDPSPSADVSNEDWLAGGRADRDWKSEFENFGHGPVCDNGPGLGDWEATGIGRFSQHGDANDRGYYKNLAAPDGEMVMPAPRGFMSQECGIASPATPSAYPSPSLAFSITNSPLMPCSQQESTNSYTDYPQRTRQTHLIATNIHNSISPAHRVESRHLRSVQQLQFAHRDHFPQLIQPGHVAQPAKLSPQQQPLDAPIEPAPVFDFGGLEQLLEADLFVPPLTTVTLTQEEAARRTFEINQVIASIPQSVDSDDESIALATPAASSSSNPGSAAASKKRLNNSGAGKDGGPAKKRGRWDIAHLPVSPGPIRVPFVTATADATPDEHETVRRQNELIAEERKRVARARNNDSAKRSRQRRELLTGRLKVFAADVESERDWWKMKAIALGASMGDYLALPVGARRAHAERYVDEEDIERYRQSKAESERKKAERALKLGQEAEQQLALGPEGHGGEDEEGEGVGASATDDPTE